MQRDKLFVLGVFVLLLIGAIAALRFAGSNGEAKPLSPEQRKPLIPSKRREFLGVSLQLQSGYEKHPFEQYIREIAETGANTVCLVVPGYQENGKSTSIFIDARKAPSQRRLEALIRYARTEDAEHGKPPLKVVLMPIVLMENPRSGDWRGSIDPADWEDWWEDYSKFMVHFARIAKATNVEVLMVGSELVTTEKQTERWTRLIESVREVYDGRLSYSANWDHYRVPQWWNKLDIIGLTTYYDLTGGKAPTLDRLRAAWKPIKKEILSWRNSQYPKHPILFTEVGWPNQVTCAQYPWDYYRAPDKPDPEAQANCFQAFFEAWMDEPAVAGYLIWEWRSYPEQKTGPEDTSYIPCGKPSLDVIKKHFRAGMKDTTRPAEDEKPASTERTR